MSRWIQRQRGGDGSTNLQAQVAKFGIDYEDAKNIAMDVFDHNFNKLARRAHQVAFERAEEFVLNFLTQLHERKPLAIQNISDPGVQSDILASQSGFAKSGDQGLGQVLVDILVDRTQRLERNITSLCLSESLSVAQKLTNEHFGILSAVFILRSVKFGVRGPAELYGRLDGTLTPLLKPLVDASQADIQYLSALGCMTISVGSADPYSVMINTYPGLFSKGLLPETSPDLAEFMGGDLIIPCLRDAEKFQVNAVDLDALHESGELTGLGEAEITKLSGLLRTNLLAAPEISEELRAVSSSAFEAIERFNFMQLPHATNTAIGTAIGHANLRRCVPGQFDAELEVWIS